MPRPQSHQLGQSLIGNKRLENKKRRNKHNFVSVPPRPPPPEKPLTQSVTQQSALDEFVSLAQLAQRDFSSKRPDYKIIVPNLAAKTEEVCEEIPKSLLRIPRRPKWEADWTKEELDAAEKEQFLNWRRNLSLLQESSTLSVTPYERNIELWRQLWRVIEKANLIVQILDARNPLLFRCEDLETYVREVDPAKEIMLLVNKADFLTANQINLWREYFAKIGVPVVFWSALTQEPIPGVCSPEELLSIFKEKAGKCGNAEYCVGMIGYPNVGKSSTINSLLNSKKTAVSTTPGRTKHFQTLYLTDARDLLLCDCPGLVMPNFVADKSELVLSSVLPTHQLLDYLSPVTNIMARISVNLLSKFYNVQFESSTSRGQKYVEDFLSALCVSRNWMSKRRPNVAKGGLKVIRDYCGGKLLYCHAPPGVEDFGSIEKLEERLRGVKVRTVSRDATCDVLLSGFDEVFFKAGKDSKGFGLMSYNPMQMKGRPGRRDGRKLRNVFDYLDKN